MLLAPTVRRAALRPSQVAQPAPTAPSAPQRALRKARLLFIVVALTLVASGCIVYEEQIAFDANGGGTFELTFALDTSMMSALGGASGGASGTDGSGSTGGMSGSSRPGGPRAPQPGREEVVERFGDAAEITTFSEGAGGETREGFMLRVPFASPAAFSELIVALASSDEDDGDGDDDLGAVLELDVKGTVYTLTGWLPPLFGDEDKSDPFARLLFGTARRTFAVTLPGQVTAANADTREGQTYRWTLDPLSSEGRSISITWNAAGNPAASVAPAPPAATPSPTPARR